MCGQYYADSMWCGATHVASVVRINAILDLLLVIFEVPEVDVEEVRPPKLVVETARVKRKGLIHATSSQPVYSRAPYFTFRVCQVFTSIDSDI